MPSRGELVIIFKTPVYAFGPYRADEGPNTTSICFTSSNDTGITLYAINLKDGTFAILPSVSVSSLELNEVLNPLALKL